ncbi:MAG: hypothetical protein KKC20_08870 [Proteobacteria bacterium]|nr:hypothetical protein [Pseudomonadota bacterium]
MNKKKRKLLAVSFDIIVGTFISKVLDLEELTPMVINEYQDQSTAMGQF